MSNTLPPTPMRPDTPRPTPGVNKKPVWQRWWFWVAVVVAVLIVASAGGGLDSGGSADTSSTEEAGIGDRVSDGLFTFTVTDVKCGESSIGSGVFKAEAQGEYCLVSMRVENTGAESQLMDASSQYMFIGDKEYSTSSDALLALDDSETSFSKRSIPATP